MHRSIRQKNQNRYRFKWKWNTTTDYWHNLCFTVFFSFLSGVFAFCNSASAHWNVFEVEPSKMKTFACFIWQIDYKVYWIASKMSLCSWNSCGCYHFFPIDFTKCFDRNCCFLKKKRVLFSPVNIDFFFEFAPICNFGFLCFFILFCSLNCVNLLSFWKFSRHFCCCKFLCASFIHSPNDHFTSVGFFLLAQTINIICLSILSFTHTVFWFSVIFFSRKKQQQRTDLTKIFYLVD